MGRNKVEAVTASEPEDNTEILARQECSRLARQLRLMENDKRAYLEESNAAINRQKKLIEMLKKENYQIHETIKSEKERQDKEKSSGNMEKVLALVDYLNRMEEEYNKESKIHREVAKKMASTFYRVKQLKTKVVANMTRKELPLPQLENKYFILNKKLETVRSQFDTIIAENTSLREKIDETLQENTLVKRKCENLENEVTKGKKEIDEVVTDATESYDQREETVSKINALSERNAKETKQYTLEMSELTRLIRHEEKLLEFMSTKNKERIFLETDDERISRIEQAKEHIMDQALESYRENFEKLLTSESPTISSLLDEYKELHDNNIRRFAYINELYGEVETTQNEFFHLRVEIKKCSQETVERNRAKNYEIICKQAELEAMKLEFEEVQTTLMISKTAMIKIVELIEKLYRLTDFNDADPVLALLGNQRDITPQNAIMYINIVQPRIAELINFKSTGEFGVLTPRLPSRAVSEISLFPGLPRPRITVSARKDTLPPSDDEIGYNLVGQEQNPLGYAAMRHKVLDYVSRSPTSLSGDEFDL